MLSLLEKRDAWTRANIKYGTGAMSLEASIELDAQTPWTPDAFISFIDRLGNPQRTALSLLVTRRRVTDAELRKAVHVTGNQALAGVLSGISKQAAALGIPARDIFSFENLRSAGKRRSTYTVADKFAEIASKMNWPGPQNTSEK